MPSDLLDLEAILGPIEGDSPTGSDLHDDFSSSYHQAQGARDAARRLERELHTAFDPEGRPRYRPVDVRAKWVELRDACLDVLTRGSKDLHVASWLVEALARTDGFQGIAAGLEVTRELVERYWDGLFPGPDEDPDPEDGPFGDRLRHLTGLLSATGGGSLCVHLSLVELAEDAQGEAVNGYRIDQGLRAERSGGASGTEDLRRAFAGFDTDHFNRLLGALAESLEQLASLDARLSELCGEFAPSTTPLREALDKVQRDLRFLLQGIPQAATALAAESETSGADEASADGEGESEAGAAPQASAAPPAKAGGPPQTREEALRYLRFAVEWFRGHEPHSPVSYACEQAIRWADLSLPELMDELIEDSSVRGSFYKLTGIRAPSSE